MTREARLEAALRGLLDAAYAWSDGKGGRFPAADAARAVLAEPVGPDDGACPNCHGEGWREPRPAAEAGGEAARGVAAVGAGRVGRMTPATFRAELAAARAEVERLTGQCETLLAENRDLRARGDALATAVEWYLGPGAPSSGRVADALAAWRGKP